MHPYIKAHIRFDSTINRFYFMFQGQKFLTLKGKPYSLPWRYCHVILFHSGWRGLKFNGKTRLCEGTNPEGKQVCFTLSTARWLVAHAIHDDDFKAQQEIAGMFLDKP